MIDKIMISYDHDDAKIATLIERDLTIVGYKVWLDSSGIQGGASWIQEIQAAIKNCDLLIPILSFESLESDWVQREVIYAQNNSKIILPLKLKAIELPVYLVTTQALDFTDDYNIALQRLLKVLTQLSNTNVKIPTKQSQDTQSIRNFRRKLRQDVE
jgi:hypothetical protein